MKRSGLLDEYNELLELRPEIPELHEDLAREMQARCLHMQGRVERYLKNAFEQQVILQGGAKEMLATVKRPPEIELRRYAVSEVQARGKLADSRLKNSSGSFSREFDSDILRFNFAAKQLEIDCALAGDVKNRVMALVQQMNAIDLYIRAIARAPQEENIENDAIIEDLIRRYLDIARIAFALYPSKSLQYRIDNLNEALVCLPAIASRFDRVPLKKSLVFFARHVGGEVYASAE